MERIPRVDDVRGVALMFVAEEARLHGLNILDAKLSSFGGEDVEHRARHVDRDDASAMRSNSERKRASAGAEIDEGAALVEAEAAQQRDLPADVEVSLAVVTCGVVSAEVLVPRVRKLIEEPVTAVHPPLRNLFAHRLVLFVKWPSRPATLARQLQTATVT